MNGQLAEHPLAELIREISFTHQSGALRLVRQPAQAVLYFDKGRLVFVTSNLRAHRLLEALRRAQVIAEEQLQLYAGAAPLSDQQLGLRLVKDGLLTLTELKQTQASQIAETLRFLLLWIDGEWSFDRRARLLDNIQVDVNTGEFLIESARRLPPEFVARRFKNTSEKISPAGELPQSVNLLSVEGYVLSRAEGKMSIAELIALTGLSETATQQAIYALVLGGFLELDAWPFALSSEHAAQTSTASPPVKTASALASSETPKQKINSLATNSTTTAVKADLPGTVSNALPEEKDAKVNVEDLFQRAAAESYYQMLGVGRSAASADIKRAYYKLAKQFHPDLFHRDADQATRSRIEDAFAKITKAYELLNNSTQRAAYDTKLERESKRAVANPSAQTAASSSSVANPSTTRAAESLQQGLIAERNGNQLVAAAAFAEAVRLAPQRADYRAQYAATLMRHTSTRRQAEAELQVAIKLDPGNAAYRVRLAELYLTLGLARRAESEIERALAIDPQHSAARQMRDQMRSNPKANRT